MEDKDFAYQIIHPESALADFVEMFWMLTNHSDKEKEIVIIPDGRIDIIFSYSNNSDFQATLLGLDNKPSETTFAPKTIFFSVSLKLPAIEYILNRSISDLFNTAMPLPADFWGVQPSDLFDFEKFCNKVTTVMNSLIQKQIDPRKQKLFQLIYASQGAMTVKELSEQVFWSSRQINRYFNQQFGITLKEYCNILRFRASFPQIKEGKLYPQQNFSDQAHFIKEVKRYSGVVPKELSKNKNDRFLQFSALDKK